MTRLNVTFSENAYRTLEELAKQRGTSKAEILRDSIALEKWFEEARQEGGKILIEKKNGELREVFIR